MSCLYVVDPVEQKAEGIRKPFIKRDAGLWKCASPGVKMIGQGGSPVWAWSDWAKGFPPGTRFGICEQVCPVTWEPLLPPRVAILKSSLGHAMVKNMSRALEDTYNGRG